jgi:rhodanese-related sulfurtransferase
MIWAVDGTSFASWSVRVAWRSLATSVDVLRVVRVPDGRHSERLGEVTTAEERIASARLVARHELGLDVDRWVIVCWGGRRSRRWSWPAGTLMTTSP